MRHFLTLILTPVLLFCTAVPPDAALPDYLISEIPVTCPQRFPAPLQINDQQAMGEILQYLRAVPLHGKADTVSIFEEMPQYTIRLTHAAGHVTHYRQLGAEYLSKNDSPWYHIDPEDGRILEELFHVS